MDIQVTICFFWNTTSFGESGVDRWHSEKKNTFFRLANWACILNDRYIIHIFVGGKRPKIHATSIFINIDHVKNQAFMDHMGSEMIWFWSALELEVWIGQCWCQSAHGHLEDLEVGESYPDDVQICAVCISLRIQVRPKKGINHTIQLWVWDWDHQSYSRGSSAFSWGIL